MNAKLQQAMAFRSIQIVSVAFPEVACQTNDPKMTFYVFGCTVCVYYSALDRAKLANTSSRFQSSSKLYANKQQSPLGSTLHMSQDACFVI